MTEEYRQLKRFFEESIAFDKHLGIVIDEMEKGFAKLSLPFRPEFMGDPFRPALHGGVTSTLVDVAAGVAALSTVPLGSKCSTVDMRVDFLRPGKPTDLVALAKVVRMGSRVAVCNVQVYQDDEQIAEGRAVYSMSVRKPSS